MKKLAIASGKGGVGKSMLTSSLAILFSKDKKKILALDCDVDAPNLSVWLGETNKWKKVKEISVSEKPIINSKKLTKKEAEICAQKCKFNALNVVKGKLKLNYFLCEGCGAFQYFCPQGTIKFKPVINGEIRIKTTKYGFPIISGHLYPGETGSGKIVTEIKQKAEEFNKEIILIDSAPGTGCPVIASLQDSDFVLLITEPTPSGFSDLKRVLEVVNHFKVPWAVVINKYELNKKLAIKIKKWAETKFLGSISYDKNIFKAISNLTPIMETNLKAKKEITKIYNKLKEQIN